jgi:hypothetical protein
MAFRQVFPTKVRRLGSSCVFAIHSANGVANRVVIRISAPLLRELRWRPYDRVDLLTGYGADTGKVQIVRAKYGGYAVSPTSGLADPDKPESASSFTVTCKLEDLDERIEPGAVSAIGIRHEILEGTEHHKERRLQIALPDLSRKAGTLRRKPAAETNGHTANTTKRPKSASRKRKPVEG